MIHWWQWTIFSLKRPFNVNFKKHFGCLTVFSLVEFVFLCFTNINPTTITMNKHKIPPKILKPTINQLISLRIKKKLKIWFLYSSYFELSTSTKCIVDSCIVVVIDTSIAERKAEEIELEEVEESSDCWKANVEVDGFFVVKVKVSFAVVAALFVVVDISFDVYWNKLVTFFFFFVFSLQIVLKHNKHSLSTNVYYTI